MEWSWRTILILIGLIAIAAIMIDGFRRMKRARAEALKFDLQPGADDLIDDDYNPELPGSVRVVSGSEQAESTERREPSFGGDTSFEAEELRKSEPSQSEFSQPEPEQAEPAQPDTTTAETLISNEAEEDTPEPLMSADVAEQKAEPVAVQVTEEEPLRPAVIPTAKPVDLDEKVPVLLDVEEFGHEGIISAPRVVKEEPEVPSSQQTSEPVEKGEATATPDEYITEQVEEPEEINAPHLEEEVEASLVEESSAEDDTTPLPVNYAGNNAEVLADRPVPSLVLVIHALAKDHSGFSGHQLLHFFNSCDLRYGEKDIFHRFEEADGQGRIQFSVAQIENPGTFNPAHMSEQRFRGLSFFMSLPGAKRPLEAYEAMSEMAMAVARNLKADVLDESHSAMTPQTMEHERQQILEYERQQRLAAKKRQ